MANYELSNRIYELRTQKGLSQKELGAILGVSNKAVSKWETGTAIPKTETLIKLAEVFEISTEELLNMALPLQNPQPTSKNILIPTNARIGKTLSEFRAEHGLYLKDVAEKIGVDENELQEIENSGLVPDEIANRLVVAYNLPKNDFAKPVFKSKTVTKKYFLKTAFIYEIIFGAVCLIPSLIVGILTGIAMLFNIDVLEETITYAGDLSFFLSPIFATLGGILLGKYLTEKSGYIGDFNRYRFLYVTVPVAASATITSFTWFVIGLVADYVRDTFGSIKTPMYALVQGTIELIFSLMGTAVIVIVLATLMNNAIEQNLEKRRQVLKIIAITVTASIVLAHILEVATLYIRYHQFELVPYVEDFFVYCTNIIIVWLVYSIAEHNPKKEKWTFKILPIISIWGLVGFEILRIIGFGLEELFMQLLERLLEVMGL